VQKNMANITHFLSYYSTKYKKKKLNIFYHANLEIFVYKIVT